MAAAALLAFSPLANPKFSANLSHRCVAKAPAAVPRFSFSYRRSHVDALSSPCVDLSLRVLAFGQNIRRGLSIVASYNDSAHPDNEVEKEKAELKADANEAQKAWEETLESFKEEALKMKEKSQEAYEVYSTKAMVVLKETSEKLKIEADKAKQDLSIVAKHISEEGKVYLTTAAEKSPEPVKDVVETFASSTDNLKDVSQVRDFHVGIPYGTFLSIGGFLWFMLTGSIAALRFGVILGGTLLGLSVASLRSWKTGQSTKLLLTGQAAIATIIFLGEWCLLCQKQLFSTKLMTLLSGAVVAFYVYKIIVSGSSKGPASEHSSES